MIASAEHERGSGMGHTLLAREKPILPLREGDRLTREEFELRYDASPDVLKAELINGVVHIEASKAKAKATAMPPVSNQGHAFPHFSLIGWLAAYQMATPGVEGSDNPSLRLPSVDNMPQPDCILRILPSHGGQASDDPDDMLAGAPELVAEVAASSAPLDLGPKFDVYERDGVCEYVVWRPAYQTIDWFRRNRAGRFVSMRRDGKGLLKRKAFPGLWLDPQALLARNMTIVSRVIRRGIASPEHAAFVAKLAAVAKRKKGKGR
jgi:hypothetical protein